MQWLLALLLTAFMLIPAGVSAQSAPNTSTWMTNLQVETILCTSSTVYLGGNFTYVGLPTGNAFALDPVAGQPVAPFAQVSGIVYACIPDGAGGWFIGGDFTAIGSVTRNRLAHLLADGRLDSAWDPNVDNTVYALALSGATLYAGGNFSSIGGQMRNKIGAVDAASGAASAWNPNITGGLVSALAVSGATVYAGGSFTTVGATTSRQRLAALDAATGLPTSWNPGANSNVEEMVVSGPTLYICGSFSDVNGTARNRVAAFDLATGALTPWAPSCNGTVYAMAIDNGVAYLGGAFTTCQGQPRNRIAAVDAATGAVSSWDPNADATIFALNVNDGQVTIGGDFTSIGGQPRVRLASLDPATGAPQPWDFEVDNRVRAIGAASGRIFVGGDFSWIGRPRQRLAAIDVATGRATAWNPGADDYVLSLARSGSTIYAGGAFTSIGGQPRNRIAGIDAATGAATAWNPGADGDVQALDALGSTVYAGGKFTTIGGQPRARLAALDPATSTVLAGWVADANNEVRALKLDQGRLYVGGAFTSLAGRARKGIEALDAATGAPAAWNPPDIGTVSALALADGILYLGGKFSFAVNGQAYGDLAALDAATGQLTGWRPEVSGYGIQSLAVLGSHVYAGGLLLSLPGESDQYAAAAFYTGSGVLAPWRQIRNGFIDYAAALAVSGSTLYAGGLMSSIGGQSWSHFARFDPVPPPAGPSRAGVADIQATKITWNWPDDCAHEDGVKIWADPGAGAPTTLRAAIPSGVTTWPQRSLTPNTRYSFQAAATNLFNDAPRTATCSRYTLAHRPQIGENVLCAQPTSVYQPAGTGFVFSNPAGFGPGTHGGSLWRVSAFNYAWDTSPEHAFTGSEPKWSSGRLTLLPTEPGIYYLHLQSVNEEGIAGPTLDYGPFFYADQNQVPLPHSDSIPSTATWATNGVVRAIVRTSTTVYLGGSFTQIGRATGSGLPYDLTTGRPIAYPHVQGTVSACAPDGAGGWFIGGTFTQVGDQPRSNIAHILAGGIVDTAWNPGASSTVSALAVAAGKVYAGGSFQNIGGQPRNRIAALDAATSAVLAWNPNADSTVRTLAVAGGVIYAGGDFTSIGGQPRSRIAALDDAANAITTWDPNASSIVYALAIADGMVYAGGSFASIGGQPRNRIAALDPATGLATGWNPNADSPIRALAVSDGVVYAGGTFSAIGGQPRSYLAALDPITGLATPWNPGANGGVNALAATSSTVYAGGSFTSIGGQPRGRLAALDAATGTPAPWSPDLSGTVNALALNGGMLYAGGAFALANAQARSGLAALDAATGTLLNWTPNVGGSGVNCMALAGGMIYVGNTSTATSGYYSALDPVSGEVIFKGGTEPVQAMAVSDGVLYIGGGVYAGSGGGLGYGNSGMLAALKPETGVSLWVKDPSAPVFSLAISGGVLYAGGYFQSFNEGGSTFITRHYLAALDAASGAIFPWDPNADNTVFALKVLDGTVYAGGDFTTIGGQPRSRIAAIDVASGLPSNWNPGADNSVRALAILNNTLYAGGRFLNIGGQPRSRIAALDLASAAVKTWDPGVPGTGTTAVYELNSFGTSLDVGGNFSSIGGQPQACYATFDLGPPLRPSAPGANGIQTDRITWRWFDNACDEDGFKVWADAGSGAPVTLRAMAAANATSWTMGGLTPNTLYTFQAAATSAAGDSARTDAWSIFTLPAPPSPGDNFACDRSTNTWLAVGMPLTFSNPAGFGAGTHGGSPWRVSGYRYAWNASPTHTFGGSEPIWNNAALIQAPASAGSYWLHLQSLNVVGEAQPMTLNIGPFLVTAPPAVTTQPTSQTVDLGVAVSFTVGASGGGLSFQWFKNGTPLANSGGISGVMSATLSLGAVTEAAEGNYTCQVSNTAGGATSRAAALQVLRPGALGAAPNALRFTEGSGFEVDVVHGGTPQMQSVVLTNTGEKPLTFTGPGTVAPGLAIGGRRAADFQILSVTPSTATPLAPGSSLTVVVRFAPTATARTLGLDAVLAVTTDSPVAPTLTIPLLGDAVPVGLSRFAVE